MTPDKVRAIAPEFKDDPDEVLQVFLDLALEIHGDASPWGNVYGTAMAYFAAHLQAVAAQGDPDATGAGAGAGQGASGAVTGMAVGRWSWSFGGNLNGSEGGMDPGLYGSLVTTRHGKMYLFLRKTRPNARGRLIRPKGTY